MTRASSSWGICAGCDTLSEEALPLPAATVVVNDGHALRRVLADGGLPHACHRAQMMLRRGRDTIQMNEGSSAPSLSGALALAGLADGEIYIPGLQ
jgi:hypothetical protein